MKNCEITGSVGFDRPALSMLGSRSFRCQHEPCLRVGVSLGVNKKDLDQNEITFSDLSFPGVDTLAKEAANNCLPC